MKKTPTIKVRMPVASAVARSTKSGTKLESGTLAPWEQERLDALSDDAKSSAYLFHANPAMVLTFNTPARIHPRMRAALDELVSFGALQMEREPGGALHFTVHNVFLLRRVPKLSAKEHQRVALPITTR